MTTVISVRGRKPTELLTDPNFVYVGRKCAGWKASLFGNPFKPGDDVMTAFRMVNSHPGVTSRFEVPHKGNGLLTVADCLLWYERLVLACAGMQRLLPELRGKTLGCWCCDYDGVTEPMPLCHAAILARMANNLEVRIPCPRPVPNP